MEARTKKILSFSTVAAIAVVAGGYWATRQHFVPREVAEIADHGAFFTDHYPANIGFVQELYRMRAKRKLTTQNEVLIQRSVTNAAQSLHMPPAVLWCLFFQESRLNHLEGIESGKAARGLGQFIHFSFDEVNTHLNKYGPEGLNLLVQTFGRDIRPIAALDTELNNPSSYYFIPTAVSSSAAFLNNRYLQLKKNLEAHNVPYDSDLLWVYAAMAYNKGSRSVLSFWNYVQTKKGTDELHRITNERAAFFKAVGSKKLLERSLRRIWPPEMAGRYASELAIHVENFKSCALKQKREVRRTNTDSVRF